jgi:5-methylcytosine-specific restriction protein A
MLTDGRFCPAHAKQDAREYEKYRRDPETRKHYGRAWKRIRDRYVAVHPLCERCEKDGRLTPTQEVHHIKPLSEGGTHDVNNLMALCSSCHSGITLGENNRRRSDR